MSRPRVLNPVLMKELRVRMRGPRAFWIMLLYLSAAMICVCVVYSSFIFTRQRVNPSVSSAELGRHLFQVLMIGQAALLCLVAPGLTAGGISLEREQQSLPMLLVTLLRPRTIVLGKLLSSLSYLVLLVVCNAPFVALVFLYGGVSWRQVLEGHAVLLICAVYFGAVGLWWSAVCRRTGQSAVISYGSMVAWVLGGPALAAGLMALSDWLSWSTGPWMEEAVAFLLSLNPGAAMYFLLEGPGSSTSLGWGICQQFPLGTALYAVLTLGLFWLTVVWVRRMQVP